MSHDPKPLGGKIISKPVIIFGPLIVLCMLLSGLRIGLSLRSERRFPMGCMDRV